MLSNVKVGVYEFLGLIIPGMLFLCEGWILVRGWPRFIGTIYTIHAGPLTLFLICSFVVGHFVQELADSYLKRFHGQRFLRKGRDELWGGPEADAVKSAIWAESGITMANVDPAFDYCLTRVGDAFNKRDNFLATSDLSRSFLVLATFGLAPALRLSFDRAHHSVGIFLAALACYLLLLLASARLAWIRMVRFRDMSDTGVFRAYLGSRAIKNSATIEAGRDFSAVHDR
jgi:hypothetical protein